MHLFHSLKVMEINTDTTSIVVSLSHFIMPLVALILVFEAYVLDFQSLMRISILHNLRYYGNSTYVEK
ncbi:CQS_1a_G0027640.mRNA.1.CDS.1 [Saccharomyces cerevisiae]|nr:CQS_1a_G0027640.mRNA.1.CDS.1 [Saccharomyces cerevisiae]CAI7343151.1 CQS_1a_G0027640.mRNA.1.CDS.1 [Saccharomyces cerevisiae]